ncbi:type II toxin-antitoxin system prevent-host-death family antitoxin [Halomonas qinghailakensis]|uniref:Antitoxin n=1 Tax=Halomonas qinghailakensis TaxID=2937790 RepID=A0AA46TTE2_9GAMM|nr:type II toxin-antitoxin system prevent-host-death family antitoxin [Halomonas sp. ZZQ-149]UYO76144.1 type II toxin-antitoxin system prevent-host-death family antitoxin [Halomonas sp. ZZQ-149]
MHININEAQKKLSLLAQKAVEGEEIIITEHGKPVARLVPCEKPPARLKQLLGAMKDEIQVTEGWDEPLVGQELLEFYKDNLG